MNIEKATASNGEETCSADGTKLHSAYNPSREAERFVKALSCPFEPVFILVTEPALSYCLKPLKETYPLATLCCVRYTEYFRLSDSAWNNVFYANPNAPDALCEELFAFMGEEGLSLCFFASWQPSDKAFSVYSDYTWKEIKKAVLKSRDVLATRTYFSRRWAKNSLKFSLFCKNFMALPKTTLPCLVCASGPSLGSSIQHIKEERKTFFLIAASSALSVLLYNGIIPDICISTDGGYWAKEHLKALLRKDYGITLALSPESAASGKLLSCLDILPLSYGDGFSEDFIKGMGFYATKAERNGTVSGTAVRLALAITSANVYVCGLDLAQNKGFSHTQPNELELNAAHKDFRLCTKETRLTPTSFYSPTLDIYRRWFASTDFKGRLFRLSNAFPYPFTLGGIKDVDWDFFKKQHSAQGSTKISRSVCSCSEDIKERKDTLKKIIKDCSLKETWKKEAFPALSITVTRSLNKEEKDNAKGELEKKMRDFADSLYRTLGESK